MKTDADEPEPDPENDINKDNKKKGFVTKNYQLKCHNTPPRKFKCCECDAELDTCN